MRGVDDCLSASCAEYVDDNYNTAYAANTGADTDCDDNGTTTNTEADIDADCDDHGSSKTNAGADFGSHTFTNPGPHA